MAFIGRFPVELAPLILLYILMKSRFHLVISDLNNSRVRLGIMKRQRVVDVVCLALLLVSFGIFALWLSRTGNDEENKVAACVRIDQVNYFSSFLSYLSD